MRDGRFVAEHRGGPLKKEQHHQLMLWACDCSEHVLHLFGKRTDVRLRTALKVAKAWTQGKASVGDARNAAFAAHAVAREAKDPSAIAVARSVGHAVATAHMADHSLGAALYALKAVKNAGRPMDAEWRWQVRRLQPDIKGLVRSAMRSKKFKNHFPRTGPGVL